jgi:hypothetical protein
MSDLRERAIKDVAEALHLVPLSIENFMDGQAASGFEKELAAYAVSQRERVLELEEELRGFAYYGSNGIRGVVRMHGMQERARKRLEGK